MSICTSSFTRSSHFEFVIMEGRPFRDIVRGLIFIQIFLTSVCVGLSPCIPESDPLGRYTVRSGSGNIWTEGIPSGSVVQVHVRCDQGAIAQPSVTSQCSNGIWIQAWPRCEKPCSVPRNRGVVRQFVNGLASMPVDSYTRPTLPDGTHIVARCYDPGKARLIGDQRRTCHGGLWTGEEPQCEPVETKVLFNGAPRQVASNGTVEVYVHRQDPRHLYVICRITRWGLRPPRLTTPLVNDRDLPHTHYWYDHRKKLDPITTEYSGTYTCSGSSKSHSVHVVFKVSRCPELTIPDHAVMVGVYGYGRNIGDERIFHCRQGYVLRGDTNNLRCLEGGVWSDPLPTCEGVPDEDPSPTQATEDNNPVDYSSSSSFEVYPPGVRSVPTKPPNEGQSPSQAEEDTDPLDYPSSSSSDTGDSISSFGSIAETSPSTPVNSTHTQPDIKGVQSWRRSNHRDG